MIVLITGASSGIGRAMAQGFARRGFNLILVARRRERLQALKEELVRAHGVRVKVICRNLSDPVQCRALFEEARAVKPDILINNAGFGVFGEFYETDLDRELEMIDTNIKAVHILTKLFYRDFRDRDYGFILNVGSVAGLMAGPLMAAYYAGKNYIVQLTKAIYEEIRADGANVYIGVLCPGPVRTEFNAVAGVKFADDGLDEAYVAEYAIEAMFDGGLVIIPGKLMKTVGFAARVTPTKLMLRATRQIQTARKSPPQA